MNFPLQSVDANDMRPQAIATFWHTACLLVLLAMFSGVVFYLRFASATPRLPHPPSYAIVLAFEWATFALTLWHSDAAFAAYLRCAVQNPRNLRWDIPIAVLFMIVLLGVTAIAVRFVGESHFASTAGMLPHGVVEKILWLALAISAGICEETVFRGYLQQQFSAWTGSAAAGIVVQGILFGLCHAYQGWGSVTLICVWGCLLGAFAWWRKGLRANMIAHAVVDSFPVFQ